MTTGFIAACYSLTLLSMAALAWSTVRSGRKLAEQVPDEEKPWI